MISPGCNTLAPLLVLTSMMICVGCGPGGSKTMANNDNKLTTISSSPDTTGSPDVGEFSANLPAGFNMPSNDVGRRLLKEYGAVFVVRGEAVPPKTVVYKDEAAVRDFQSSAPASGETVGGVAITLQIPAMKALKEAVSEGSASGLTITPRGSDAAKRSYQDTVGLWASRVEPGLDHWADLGQITTADAARIRSLSPYEQVPEILKLEAQGMFFAKDLSKSIIYSVAPPGSSQHLSMLALDVTEHEDPKIRSLLAKHGWFQTVVSDLPHFTYLGVAESELTKLGLRKTTSGGRVFWIPDL